METRPQEEAAELKKHYSGLWVGEAVPNEEFAQDTPVNPIKWAMTILTDKSSDQLSVFGSGFFDDAADIVGEPVLFFSLRGTFNSVSKEFTIEKVYDQNLVDKDMYVKFEGKLYLNGEGSEAEETTESHRMEVEIETDEKKEGKKRKKKTKPKVVKQDTQPVIKGTWINHGEQTAGVFAARLEAG